MLFVRRLRVKDRLIEGLRDPSGLGCSFVTIRVSQRAIVSAFLLVVSGGIGLTPTHISAPSFSKQLEEL